MKLYVVRVDSEIPKGRPIYLTLKTERTYKKGSLSRCTEKLVTYWDVYQREALRMSKDMAQMVASHASLMRAKVIKLVPRKASKRGGK